MIPARLVDVVLLAAIGVDVFLSAGSALFPQSWFSHLHVGITPDDLHVTLLRRAGAQWAMFAVMQVIALFRWRRSPRWLLLTAGARMCDWLTDLTYLLIAPALSASAGWELAAPPVLNVGMALVLIRAYSTYARPKSP